MSSKLLATIRALAAREEGATMLEYALLAFLIAVALVAVVSALAPPFEPVFTGAKDGLEGGS